MDNNSSAADIVAEVRAQHIADPPLFSPPTDRRLKDGMGSSEFLALGLFALTVMVNMIISGITGEPGLPWDQLMTVMAPVLAYLASRTYLKGAAISKGN